VGSLGDLHPFIALGQALNAHGVNVLIASAPEYQSKVEGAGLRFHSLRPGFEELQHDLGMSRAELARRVVRRSDFLFRKLVLPYLRAAYEDMMLATADADLVLSSSLGFGARLAAEKRGIPCIAVVLQPMMFLSAYDPPEVPGLQWLSKVLRELGPAPTRRALWLLKRAVNTVFEVERVSELGRDAAGVYSRQSRCQQSGKLLSGECLRLTIARKTRCAAGGREGARIVLDTLEQLGSN
jgi:UDP:flavonoid glycosyltransferase YjiC (YdhE family)